MTRAEMALKWLNKRPNCELSHTGYYCDDDHEWQVHKVTGGINDREWTKVGSGTTPLAALEDATAVARWRTDMAPHFLAAEHVDVGAVDHVQGVAQDRLDALADAGEPA